LEEESVVRFVKNKNRCLQGINKKQLTNLILDILKIRDYANKKLKGGRRYTNLSVNAKRALQNKKLSRSFWKRWDAKHDDLRMKRQGTVTMNRAMNCTRDMASSHLDALAKELIDAGIFTNTKQVAPGVWTGQINTSRVFNHDETPQFINYGVDGTPNGLVYAGRGESCKRMINENRECVTINPVVSVSGFVCVCQVIFGTTGITDHMAPKTVVEKIDNLLISTTDNGCQDHTSLLACYKLFDKYLDKENIERPVVLTSDGHSSRFDYEVLKFCLEKKIRLFISPPDTTGVTQLLDQCNRNIHLEYKVAKACLFTPTMKVNREGFMLSLANMWDKWATPTLIRKAAKRVGISAEGLNINDMQQDKFVQAANLVECERSENTPTPSSSDNAPSSTTTPASPNHLRKGSAAYWKAKFEMAQQTIRDCDEKSIRLENIPGLLTIQKIKPKQASKSTRVTQVHGSMEGKEVIKVVKRIV
jgi:hypothetical protein